jgi:hypothetical protein
MDRITHRILCLFLLVVIFSPSVQALERRGRLGLGFNNQLATDLPALSFKLQRSRSFAFGGMVGLSTDDHNGGMGAGLKIYRILFDEPQLNFYTSLMGGYLKDKNGPGSSRTGFQFDLTLGSEFSFAGLQSLGFSLEFGVSMNKLDDFVVETTAGGMIIAAVHFYL